MARLNAPPPRATILALKGVIDFAVTRGVAYARAWPRKSSLPPRPGEAAAATDFGDTSIAIQQLSPDFQQAALELTAGTEWTWKDATVSAAYGGLATWQ